MATITSDLTTSVLHFSGTYATYKAIIESTATSGNDYTNKQAVLNGVYICTDTGQLFVRGVEVKADALSDKGVDKVAFDATTRILTLTLKDGSTVVTDPIPNVESLAQDSSDYGLIQGSVFHFLVNGVQSVSEKVTANEEAITNTQNDLTTFKNTKGAAGGLATLGTDGKVPATQLPSYVDDVVEGTLSSDGTTFTAAKSGVDTTETDKIYVDTVTNKTYRYSGTTYVPIKGDIVIGTASGNAYDGALGAALRTDLDTAKGTIADRVTFTQPTSGSALTAQLYKGTTALGTATTIPVATTSKNGAMSSTDKTNLNASLKSVQIGTTDADAITITTTKTDGSAGGSVVLPAAVASDTTGNNGSAGLLTAADKRNYDAGITKLADSVGSLSESATADNVTISGIKNDPNNAASTATIEAATSSAAGVMSAADKALLDAIAHWWTASE